MAKTSGGLRGGNSNNPYASVEARSIGLIEDGKRGKPIKVSQKYWDSLNTMERNYVFERVGNDLDGMSEVKQKLSTLKKQVPDAISVFGRGFAKDSNGNYYEFSGGLGFVGDVPKWKKQ